MELGAITGIKSFVDVVKNLKDLGYKYVSFKRDFLTDASEKFLKDASKFIKEMDIKPFSCHNIWSFPEDFKKTKEFISFKESIFEKARILNVKYLTCHFGLPSDLKTEEDFAFENYLNRKEITLNDYRKRNIELMNILCEKAKKYELFLTIENLPPGCLCDFATTVEDILNLIKEIDQPNIGICFDSGHANIAGFDMYDFILKAGNKLFETHFHDNFGFLKNDNTINDLHQICGIGNINWPKIIAGLEKINFKNPAIFEIIETGYEILQTNINNWYRFYSVYKIRLKEFNF